MIIDELVLGDKVKRGVIKLGIWSLAPMHVCTHARVHPCIYAHTHVCTHACTRTSTVFNFDAPLPQRCIKLRLKYV